MGRVLGAFFLIMFLPACAGSPFAARSTSISQAPLRSSPQLAPPTERLLPTALSPTSLRPTAVPATAIPRATAPTQPTDIPTPTPELPDLALPVVPLDPAAQAAALLPDFRSDLDRSARWNRYTIRAELTPQTHRLSGRERLEYTNHDSVALERLYFHLYPNLPDFGGHLDVSGVTVDQQRASISYEANRYLLRVDLPQPLAPAASVVITLNFITQAPKNGSARFYGAFNLESGVCALASSYPIIAVVRDGRWDIDRPNSQGDFVTSETALYDVTLAAPLDWSLVTTGVAIAERHDGEHQIMRFVSGPQREFMISATQLAQASAETDGTRINAYYQRHQESSGRAALQAAVDAVHAFNARYGRYPLAELDIVEIAATTFLGVEYPGLIMIEQRLYASGRGLEITVAHEVAHQWWYSIVGNDVQREAWLDEALASYSQIVYQESVHDSAAAERELDGFRERYRNIRANGQDAPVEQPTAAFHSNYIGLVYGKAVLFFQALRKRMGDESFDRFLHTYYAAHRYDLVSGSDLLGSAESACGCELDELYRDWITTVTDVELP